MYIDKYWGNYIGDTDDSLNLVMFLEDQKKEEILLSEIFAKIGLDKQNWDFHQTVEYLEFTHSNGVETDFCFAIDLITDLAAILLECRVSGSVDLHELDEYNTSSRRIRVTATTEEHDAMDKALADFVKDPLSYDLHELVDDEDMKEMAELVEELRKELYEAAGSNRSCHVKEEDRMELLEQCRKWYEKNEHQKIIDALEKIPEEKRTPDMDMELARAYNNEAKESDPEGRRMLKRAVKLLQAHEEQLGETYSWNFRIGYAYYYLDQEGRALRHFEKALEMHPGDDPKFNTKQDIEYFIDACMNSITFPRFGECFRKRVKMAWETFAEQEAKLRQFMDEDKDREWGNELIAECDSILHLAFDEISFEMGYNGKKYELILTPEGDKVKLFELVYFQKHAPEKVLEHWNILVGRQPIPHIGLRTGDGWYISGEGVKVWLEEQGENSFALSAYCEKLLPMLKEEEGRAWWMLTTLTDQTLGEIPHMRYIGSFDVLEAPKEEPPILMSQLPDKLKENGLELSTDPEAYLETYIGYKMKPNEEPDADWRLDVIAGVTCCPAFINGYLNAGNNFMDNLHADGAVAGFFCYPLDTLCEEQGSQKIFDFRDRLEEALRKACGPDRLTLIGGATGRFCGYVDFIAWDLESVLCMAEEFFNDSDIPWAAFHTFRWEAGTVPLKNTQDDGMPVIEKY